MELFKRLLTAKPEVQATFVATLNLLTIFNVIIITSDQLAASNIALMTWFGLASKVAFRNALEDL